MPAPSGTTTSTGRMPTDSQNGAAAATSAGEAVIRPPRAMARTGATSLVSSSMSSSVWSSPSSASDADG